MRYFKKTAKHFALSLLILLLVVSAFAPFILYDKGDATKTASNHSSNVGIAFCGNTTAEARLLIDRVKGYTNLFVLDSGAGNPISANQTQIEEICDYAISQGLKVIVNVGTYRPQESWFWKFTPLEGIKQRWTERWGAQFLGIYYNDEIGGIQLDGNWTDWFDKYADDLTDINHSATRALYDIYLKMQQAKNNGSRPDNYDAEAEFFVKNVLQDDPGLSALKTAGLTTFTSDYCLFWFDYLGGYDVLFTELGWNCSVAQQIALAKGAARMQNKDWGAIITWKYDKAPYLDSADQMYQQMLTAYQAGAKYIVIFNYPILAGNPYGVMTDEHFAALETFWKNIVNTKDKTFADLSKPEAALVLPRNYGWGMRKPDDVIWGFWGPDEKSPVIAAAVSKLLDQYGAGLDIIYEDSAYPASKIGYLKIYYWNSTQV